MANLISVTDSTFEAEVLNADTLVLVDFWAEWCGPCRMIAPVLEELANDYQGRVKFAKVNVDDNNAISAQYGIRSIPTLMLFKDGQVVGNQVGVSTKSQLASFIDGHLA